MPWSVDSPRAFLFPMPKGRKGLNMPEAITETVDSVEAQDAVDSAAENAEVNPSMEDSSPKTLTVDEHDAIVKQRIDKQNAKHAKELEQLNAQIAEELEQLNAQKAEELEQLQAQIKQLQDINASVTAERDALKHANEVSEWKISAAKKTGLGMDVLSVLDGATEDEIMEKASVIKASISYPESHSTGKPAEVSSEKTNVAKFGEFMQQNFNK